MAIRGMNHFTILTDDTEATIAFYRDAMGLVDGPRPQFRFPGAWLYANGTPILHVVGDRARDALVPGVIDHMAFTASGLRDTLARLTGLGVAYDCRRQAGDGPWQVFFHDPNGARVELDFDADEAGPQT
jgi:catechol 2,3-dioxygenase-like lactoylglutathione lyase family enzyme